MSFGGAFELPNGKSKIRLQVNENQHTQQTRGSIVTHQRWPPHSNSGPVIFFSSFFQFDILQ